jgi:hypothetical protein
MFAFFARIASFLSPTPPAADGSEFPHSLLEHAEERAGRDPQAAHELRAAARAAMRVVR